MTVKTIPRPKAIRKDLTGQRFNRWTVIGYVGNPSGRTRWLCRCDCGREKIVLGRTLTNGSSTCCGCSRRTHGMKRTPEYNSWQAIRARCYNKKRSSYPHYGGRGITVCPRWRESFEAFYEDMGPRPSPNHSINRIDNDGPYSPDNCEWANDKEQANNRRDNINVTFNGLTLNITQWGKKLGISRTLIGNRLRDGWTVEDALTRPVRRQTK